MDDTWKPKKEVEKAQNNKTSSSYESRGNGEKMVINACCIKIKKKAQTVFTEEWGINIISASM